MCLNISHRVKINDYNVKVNIFDMAGQPFFYEVSYKATESSIFFPLLYMCALEANWILRVQIWHTWKLITSSVIPSTPTPHPIPFYTYKPNHYPHYLFSKHKAGA